MRQISSADKLRLLYLLESSGLDLPDFVKEAEVSDLEKYSEEGVPLTRAAAFADAVYAAFAQPSRLLVKRASSGLKVHGIEEETARFIKLARQKILEREQPEPVGYLGPDFTFPYLTISDVKMAADYLVKNIGSIPLEVARPTARNILKKAEYFPDLLDDETRHEIELIAGQGAGSTRSAAREIRKRAAILRQSNREKLASRLEKLARAVEEKGIRSGTLEAWKIEEIVDGIDREYLAKSAAASELRPSWQTFHVVSQTALDLARKSFVKLANGVTLGRHHMDLLDLRTISRLFGAKSAKAVRSGLKVDPEKALKWAGDLDREKADLLVRLISEREKKKTP